MHIRLPHVVWRSVWMGDDAIGLSDRNMGFGFGRKEQGEEKLLQPRKTLVQGVQCKVQISAGQMREDAPGDGKVDGVGNSRKGKIGILDQMPQGQARRVGEFGVMPALHQGERSVGGPVVADVKIRHRLAAKPQRPGTDVQKTVVRLQPFVAQQGQLQAAGFLPPPADDVAVAASGKRIVVKAGREIGGRRSRHDVAARSASAMHRRVATAMSCTDTHSSGP